MTTLSTLGQSNLLRSEFSTLQSGIQQLQNQIGTGNKTQVYGDLGTQATLDINLRNQATLVDNFKKNISELSIRTSLMDKINQTLSTSVNGRNLFGGTQTQSNTVIASATLLPTVQTAVTAAITAAGGVGVAAAIQAAVSGGPGAIATPASYYLGGPAHAPSQIDQGLTVDYSMTAGDPAFLTMMQGLYTLASLPQPVGTAATPPNITDADFDATAQAAASTISQGLTQLQSLTEKNGRNEQLLTDTSNAHDATLTVLQTQIDDIEQVNLADASTRLSQLQTELGASYKLTAELSTLNLIDFLK